MKELDLLKKSWQQDHTSYQEVSENQIHQMIYKKSSSNVKWILIISILELVLWTSISVCYSSDDYFKKLHAEKYILYFQILNYVNYAVIIWFIYKFYKNYIKISTINSTKQLMKDILNTRKTVHYYITYNIIMMAFSMILGFIIAYLYNPDFNSIKYKIAHEDNFATSLKIIGLFGGILFIFLVAFWLFYKLLYGFLLKKLTRNYNELKRNESQT